MQSPLEIRFDNEDLLKRDLVWKVLIETHFQKYVNINDTVIDVGAGYCEFINNISCKKKIAIDSSSMIKKYANKNVNIIIKPLHKIPKIYYGKVNIVFMSNFLEHLETKRDVINTFNTIHLLLKKNGKVLILQPNIDLIKERYWDRIDHNLALNGGSIVEALKITKFRDIVFIRNFLPATMQTKMPINKMLINIYSHIPYFLRPFAGQSFFVALK